MSTANDDARGSLSPSPNTHARRRNILVAVVCVGALLAAGTFVAMQLLQRDRFTNVVPSTAAVTPVFFDEAILVRMNEGSAERVHAQTRAPLPMLTGTPRVFARGPSHTIAFQSDTTPMRFQSIATDEELTAKAPLPTVKYVVTGKEKANVGTPLLIVSTSGVATLHSSRAGVVDRGPQLVRSLMNMRVARFDDDSAHIYVAYYDGGVERFELTAGVPKEAFPARGMVKAIAVKASVAVADDRGVRWFDRETAKARASFPLSHIVTMEHGHYPTWGHDAAAGLLVLTSDAANDEHWLRVLTDDGGGRELRHFRIDLPRGEKPVAITSTAREVLVATEKGGVWRLEI